jgi:CrcB protein
MPRLRAGIVAVVFAGGCLGGAARYWATSTHPGGAFPWSTLAVNLAGAFVLGLVVVVASELVPSRYLRPLVGTGFCGALTTFSSVVVSADRLFAHHRVATALGYLLATIVGGLAAAVLGLFLGRALAGGRRREHVDTYPADER